MKILFLHGWQSTPGGVKPQSLRQRGHEVLNPQLPDDNFIESVRIAQQLCIVERPAIVMGSSRGGAVAMALPAPGAPLVLLCPAWRIFGVAPQIQASTLILHSPTDDVIAFADSEELVLRNALPAAALIRTGTDHQLTDEASLLRMHEACLEAARTTGTENRS